MIRIENMFPAPTSAAKTEARTAMENLWKKTELGFLVLGERSSLWVQCEERAQELKKQGVRRVAILGMGGSSLGPKAFWEAYGQWRSDLEEMYFFDNLDSSSFFGTLQKLPEPESIHFLIISKSGTTLETLAMADFIDGFLRSRGSELARQATVISELKSSALTDWARAQKVCLLEIPEDVGGRFSVLSPVGLLPAALMGCSMNEIREGWNWAKAATELTETFLAAAIDSYRRHDQLLYFWPYSQGYEVFGGWFQQLWAESLGKARKRDGSQAEPISAPVACLGPRDQHSILQQVMEGPQPRWVWILKNNHPDKTGPRLEQSLFKGSEIRLNKTMDELVLAQANATEQALIQNETPTLVLSLTGLSPKTIGALFFLTELLVGGMGEVMGIDAFDQPGVELGKTLTKELLAKGR